MRQLKSVSMRENDVVRITGKIGDMEISRTGTVKKITSTMYGTEYATAQGVVLLDVDRQGNTGISGLKIMLVNHEPDTPLFDLDDVNAYLS